MPADFKLHQGAFLSRFRRFTRKMVPTRRAARIKISVVDGMQRGAAHSIETNSLSIGSDESCDLILIDSGIAPRHVELNFERSLFGELFSVRTNETDVSVGGTPLVPGVPSPFEVMPTDVVMGDVRIQLFENNHRDTVETTRVGSFLDRAFRVGIVVIIALTLFWATGEYYYLTAKDSYQLALTDTEPEVLAEGIDQEALITQFRQQLKEKRLAEYLDVTSNADGTMMVEGMIPSYMAGTWRQTVSWYDGNTQGSLMIARVSEMPGLVDFPPIAAIRLNEPAHVLFSNGRQAQKGSVVGGGWRINEISADGLELERWGETVTLSF